MQFHLNGFRTGNPEISLPHLFRHHDGIDFNLASIPSDFSDTSDEPFDQKYMIALFDRGYNLASHNYSWVKAPPGMESAAQAHNPNGCRKPTVIPVSCETRKNRHAQQRRVRRGSEMLPLIEPIRASSGHSTRIEFRIHC
jgi:hypothetical protein